MSDIALVGIGIMIALVPLTITLCLTIDRLTEQVKRIADAVEPGKIKDGVR